MTERSNQIMDYTMRLLGRINKSLCVDYPAVSYIWFSMTLLLMSMRQSMAATGNSKEKTIEIWISLLADFQADEFLEFLSNRLCFDDNQRDNDVKDDDAIAQMDKIADIVVNLVNDEFKDGVSDIDICCAWFAIGAALFMKYHNTGVEETVNTLAEYIKTVPFDEMKIIPMKK